MAAAQISHCQTVGWPLSADARREESPGSTEVRCRVTPGGGDPRESATESTPPTCLGLARRAVRVKRCGKSAPRRRQRRRQGKPHREQDQVGAAGIPERSGMPGRPPSRRSGRSHEALGDERPRRMAIAVSREDPWGGTEPGLHAVWRCPGGGRFSGSNRDKCFFQGTTVCIADLAVACRSGPRSVADRVVDTQYFAAVTRG
jgi:hypothetical protein